MGTKTTNGKKVKKASPNAFPFYHAVIAVLVVAVAAVVGGLLSWRKAAVTSHGSDSKLALQKKLGELLSDMESAKTAHQKATHEQTERDANALGPRLMQTQAAMIEKLLTLLKRVEAIPEEEKREERMEVSRLVEEELIELEAQARTSAGTALGKQQLGLISLVRNALKHDRSGGDDEFDPMEWTDEALREKHGLITYATPMYWDDAYANGRYGEDFDWYASWGKQDVNGHALADFMRPALKIQDKGEKNQRNRVLVLGCGNSNMSLTLKSEGHGDIVSIDVSEAVITQMREKHNGIEGMEWFAMDATKLNFSDGSFDSVIEKGMFDAMFTGTGELAKGALTEAVRVLRPGGPLISVSFAADRLDRLFGASAPEVPPALDCKTVGQLQYQQVMLSNSSTGDNAQGKDSKEFHVYECRRT